MIYNIKQFDEGKQVGTIYHFTNTYFEVVDDFVNMTKDIILNGLKSPYYDYISFTRYYDLQEPGYGSWGPQRYVVDGTKLSDQYKIQPSSFNLQGRVDEYEEKIDWPKGKHLDISKALMEVNHVFPSKKILQENLLMAIEILRNDLPSYTFNVVKEYMPYRRQKYIDL